MPREVLPIIELEDVSDSSDGDGASRRLAVPPDRAAMIKAVLYGKHSDDETDADFDADPGLKELVARTRKAAPADKPRSVQGIEASQLVSGDQPSTFADTGIISPPYDPGQLVHLVEHSNALRQNIDAYRTNVDSYGHHFVPTINLDSDDINEQLAVAMFQDRVLAGDEAPAMPKPAEVKAKLDELKHAMAVERIKLTYFFENCVMNQSFTALRMDSRQDIEATGNGYWEVLRDKPGRIAQFTLVASWTVCLNSQSSELVEVEQVVRATPITWTKRIYRRRFRTYVQKHDGGKVYFKEFGDPRTISARTGKAFASEEVMFEAEAHRQVANELVHFKVHSPRSPYGVPRWIGALLCVLGSRLAEEVNILYFDNKGIPPLVILVSGGKLSSSSEERLQDFIDGRIKGRANFHKILILEGEPASGSSGPEHTGRMRIELKPLMAAQHTDALFQAYDKENINKVGQAFRVPPLLRGDSRDFNRATAMAVLKFTEQQVFGPERNLFDDQINRLILADMGISYHRFVSNSPKTTDPEDQAKVVERLAKIGALVPRDVRALAEEILNTELKRIDEPWVDIPLPIATSGRIAELLQGPGDLFEPGKTPLAAKPGKGDDAEAETAVKRLLDIRDTLRRAEAIAVEREEQVFAQAKDAIEPGGEEISVPHEIWKDWGITPDPVEKLARPDLETIKAWLLEHYVDDRLMSRARIAALDEARGEFPFVDAAPGLIHRGLMNVSARRLKEWAGVEGTLPASGTAGVRLKTEDRSWTADEKAAWKFARGEWTLRERDPSRYAVVLTLAAVRQDVVLDAAAIVKQLPDLAATYVEKWKMELGPAILAEDERLATHELVVTAISWEQHPAADD